MTTAGAEPASTGGRQPPRHQLHHPSHRHGTV